MDPRIVLFVIFGLGLVAAVGLESWLSRKSFLSLPIVYVAAGWALFSLPLGLPVLNPVSDGADTVAFEYITEFIVIVSLAAAGIAIDRPVTWANWRQIWPLLAITMPLTIVLVGLLGWWVLGLAPASALLLGAALAPTDPVLARSVQVGPPGDNERHDVRFSLTVEAGLNDGLAFPFTYLAIAAAGMSGLGVWTLEWFAVDVIWRISAGIFMGVVIGRIGAWYVFERMAEGKKADRDNSQQQLYSTSEGLIVLGTLLLAYGLTELIEGYGFIAVFVGAVTARQQENRNRYHKMAHHFIDQIEKIVLVAVLFAFGGLLAGGILDGLGWREAAVGMLLIVAIRPLGGILAELNCNLPWHGKAAIAFLGIRGMGSLYYLAYAQNHGAFSDIDTLWVVVSFAIVASIVIHGVTTVRVMNSVEHVGAHIHKGESAELAPHRPEDRATNS
ncbi:cation:proton antiporter [Altererythrobacter aquiaggeris]|uniref:cation:proton antiporter n=1 Tax=Aestuarierythrobacter aquiaggeris TaxID=1898396 RepID=UPI00301600D8